MNPNKFNAVIMFKRLNQLKLSLYTRTLEQETSTTRCGGPEVEPSRPKFLTPNAEPWVPVSEGGALYWALANKEIPAWQSCSWFTQLPWEILGFSSCRTYDIMDGNNVLQNIWMFVRTKWWNCSCSCWHFTIQSTNLRQAKLLATPHCRWGLDTPDLTSFIKKKTSKVQKEKHRSLLKFPVFFPVVSGTVFVWILWMAARHWCLTTRGIPTPGIFKEDPLRIAGKCKFTIAIIHIIIIWIFICLMFCFMLFHVMDIWSEIYHLGYCHLQLLFANSQVL